MTILIHEPSTWSKILDPGFTQDISLLDRYVVDIRHLPWIQLRPGAKSARPAAAPTDLPTAGHENFLRQSTLYPYTRQEPHYASAATIDILALVPVNLMPGRQRRGKVASPRDSYHESTAQAAAHATAEKIGPMSTKEPSGDGGVPHKGSESGKADYVCLILY